MDEISLAVFVGYLVSVKALSSSSLPHFACLIFRTAKLIGDSRAVVAEKGFYRPYSKIVVTKSGEVREQPNEESSVNYAVSQ